MKTTKQIQEKKLKKIKKLSSEFQNKIEDEIYGLCEILDYKKSSQLSYSIDRIRLFINELNDFNL